MKLENDEEIIVYDMREKLGIIILMICVLALILIAVYKFQWYIILTTIVMYAILLVAFIKLYKNSNERNINRKMLKDIGIKTVANIVAVGNNIRGTIGDRGAGWHYSFVDNKVVYRDSSSKNRYYYIIVSYNNKLTAIRYIKENMAYDILKLLLDPFPVKKEINIPIDIYIYKNKVYADLDSVDLTKIDGYEEAKKIVEDSYNI